MEAVQRQGRGRITEGKKLGWARGKARLNRGRAEVILQPCPKDHSLNEKDDVFN